MDSLERRCGSMAVLEIITKAPKYKGMATRYKGMVSTSAIESSSRAALYFSDNEIQVS